MTKKQAREAWVAALRSGKYKQTRGKLVRKRKDGTKGYCCLGVACEVYNEHHKVKLSPSWEHEETLRDAAKAVREWLGLRTASGRFGGVGGNLASRNDEGARFTTIANIIEKEPPGLFFDTKPKPKRLVK